MTCGGGMSSCDCTPSSVERHDTCKQSLSQHRHKPCATNTMWVREERGQQPTAIRNVAPTYGRNHRQGLTQREKREGGGTAKRGWGKAPHGRHNAALITAAPCPSVTWAHGQNTARRNNTEHCLRIWVLRSASQCHSAHSTTHLNRDSNQVTCHKSNEFPSIT